METSKATTAKPATTAKTNGNGNGNGNGTAATAASAPLVKPPAGYAKVTSQVEIENYWMPEKGPIHGKLVSAYDFRQKTGRGKGQIRRCYILDLAGPAYCRVMTEGVKGQKAFDEDLVTPDLKTDPHVPTLVGVFGSAGLRDLDGLGGCFVFIQREPEQKELESGNAMWLFDISHKGTAKPLKVRQVTRVEEEAHGEAAGASGFDGEELPF